MVLLLHIIIALSSVGFTTYLFFAPTRTKLRASYTLIAMTLVSGTYLVVSTKANLIRACATGLVYVAATSIVVAYSRHKLAKESA
jgi:hypothetical protein